MLGLNFRADYPDITFALVCLMTLIPLECSVLQGLPLIGYQLDNKRHAEIIAELTRRRKQANP